jgi:hypothetical protein
MLKSKRGDLLCSPLIRPGRAEFRSGRSVAWYARLLGVQEVVSSNLTAPTIYLPARDGKPVLKVTPC